MGSPAAGGAAAVSVTPRLSAVSPAVALRHVPSAVWTRQPESTQSYAGTPHGQMPSMEALMNSAPGPSDTGMNPTETETLPAGDAAAVTDTTIGLAAVDANDAPLAMATALEARRAPSGCLNLQADRKEGLFFHLLHRESAASMQNTQCAHLRERTAGE
jgi:hypothetical protein